VEYDCNVKTINAFHVHNFPCFEGSNSWHSCNCSSHEVTPKPPSLALLFLNWFFLIHNLIFYLLLQRKVLFLSLLSSRPQDVGSTTTYADNYTLLPFTGQFAIASDYQWRIRVSCGGVYGAFSEIQTFSTPCKTAINLQASNISLSEVTLSWAHPGGDQMIIEYRKLGNSKWQTTGEITYTASHVLMPVFGAFSEATDYEWRIRVKCGSDWGSYSERAVFSTPCKTPLNLSANNISETDATISFTHPGGDNMLVEYRKLGNTKWQTTGEIAFATSHLLLPVTGQFSLNTTYEYRVRVKCGADWGSY
jgi:hypothetical protein